MKLRPLIILLLIPFSTMADDAALLLEKARFLETAKGQTEEALVVYRQIAALPPTPETRKIMIAALTKLADHHEESLRESSTFQQKMDRFMMRPPPERHALDIFGVPDKNEPLYEASLFNARKLTYQRGYIINARHAMVSITFNQPIHHLRGVSVGDTEEKLLAAFPAKGRRAYSHEQHNKIGNDYIKTGWLHDDMNDPGKAWLRVNEGLSFTLRDGMVESFTITFRNSSLK